MGSVYAYAALTASSPIRSPQAEEAYHSDAVDSEAVQAEAAPLPAADPRAGQLQEVPGLHGSHCAR